MAKQRLDPRVQALLDQYLKNGEFPTELPPKGRVLVHNFVVPIRVRQRNGTRGFRVWTQRLKDDPPVVVCKCGWSGLKHYEVKAWVAQRKKHGLKAPRVKA